MLLFLLLTASFCCWVLAALIKRLGNVRLALSEACFLSRTHTDAIKGIAAVVIIFSHIAARIQSSVSGPLRYYVMLFGTIGGIGVDLFLFASGFGNCYSISRTENRGSVRLKWLLRRTLHIVLVYLSCFVLTSIVLYLGGYDGTAKRMVQDLLRLRMPLRVTWYLKVQILLYAVLTISCFFEQKIIRGIILVGGSFASALIFRRLGYPEEWWKSTMCFAAGYYCAVHKNALVQAVNSRKNLVVVGSVGIFLAAYGLVCIFDNLFVPEVLGNLLMMVGVTLMAEFVRFDSRTAARLGTASLEIYLIHISLCSWFLRAGAQGNMGILKVVLCTAFASVIAKKIDERITKPLNKI